jgi:hypothetical protein
MCVEDSSQIIFLHLSRSPKEIDNFANVRLYRLAPVRPIRNGRVRHHSERLLFFLIQEVHDQIKCHA